MKSLDPSLELCIVTPPDIRHFSTCLAYRRHPKLTAEETAIVPRLRGSSHMTYVLHPLQFATVLRRFAPELIHIEEDPHSLVGVETVSLARLASRQARISFFVWDNLARKPRFPISVGKEAFTKYSLSRADLVVAGNREGEALLRTRKGYQGISAVLPQVGLDPEHYENPAPVVALERLPRTEDEPWIGFMGRLVPEKGLLVLLEALRELLTLKWRLLVVGNGPLEGELRGRWQTLLGPRLIHLDAVPHAQVPAHLRMLDIFVLPSRSTPFWKEQFGLILAQAMMAGAACVGTDSGAIPDVIGSAGLLVPERDVSALAHAIEELITSPSLRAEMKRRARLEAAGRFTNTAVASQYLQVFRNVVAGTAC